MQNVLIKFLLSCTLLVLFLSADADDTPNRVYIVSLSSDVEYAFNNGIAPPGSDYNLLDLITGNAGDTTAYISTIANLPFALYGTESLLAQHSWTHCVVYSIRPSINFYSVTASIRYSALNAYITNPQLFQHLELLETQQRTNNFDAWVTTSTIPGEQIESATVYQLVNNRLFAASTVSNPHYVDGESIVNPGSISIIPGQSDQNIYYIGLGLFHILPGQFCNSFSSPESIKLKNSIADHGICTKHSYADLYTKLRRNLVLISNYVND